MKKVLLFLTILFISITLSAQTKSVWIKTDHEEVSQFKRAKIISYSERQQLFWLKIDELKQSLVGVADKFSGLPGVGIYFPSIEGGLEKFLVWENSNFEPELQAKYPDIRAYVGKSISDPSAIINFSLSPDGIQTMVFRADNGTEFIEKYVNDNELYVLFESKTRHKNELPYTCHTKDRELSSSLLNDVQSAKKASNGVYKTLRLALSCTGEYAQYFGGTKADALAGMNATMTRVNGIFERDLALHLNIIANNELVIYTNPVSDPYSPSSIGPNEPALLWSIELQNKLTQILGNGAYDIGHLFGASGGGGNASCIGCVCVDAPVTVTNANKCKGMAFTSPADNTPEGDTFDIDYVVHEMGHQLGAQHTFSHTYENEIVQVEPGSGSTIMGYAGITSYNVQNHSDDYFTYRSIEQIQTNLERKTCPVSYPLDNNTPIVNAGLDYFVPKGTPLLLEGMVSDQDSEDVLTYCWEENDVGTSSTTGSNSRVSSTKQMGPNFRSFPPSLKKIRYLPKMSSILANKLTDASTWESLYDGTVNRNFNFTLTVRDNRFESGQTATDAMKITVDVTKGPFTVTSQSTAGITYIGGSTQTVTWNVANTSTLAGASTVDILFSTNVNGDETTFTTIASGLPNNGTAAVTIPSTNINFSACRFMVKASGNIFFAVNSRNFAISANLTVNDFEFQNFTLYPNPSNGNFIIQFEDPSVNELKINIVDIRGRKIYENKFTNQTVFRENIQLKEAEAGVYLVIVSDGNRKMVKRIIVE